MSAWHVVHKPTGKTLCGKDNDGTKPAEGKPCNACATAMYDIFGDLLDELETVRAERDRLAGEVETLRARLAAVEALVEDFESEVDWSSGRWDYGDNAAWESAARRVRAALEVTPDA